MAADTYGSGSEELFSDADDQGSFSPMGSPEIPLQDDSPTTSRGTSYPTPPTTKKTTGSHDGSLWLLPTKRTLSISKSTPRGRKVKELQLLNSDSSSDSDDESDRVYAKRRRRRSQSVGDTDKENASSIKDILLSLCKKVDRNSRALKEMQQQQHSR